MLDRCFKLHHTTPMMRATTNQVRATFTQGVYNVATCDQDADYSIAKRADGRFEARFRGYAMQAQKGVYSYATFRGAARVITNILNEGK